MRRLALLLTLLLTALACTPQAAPQPTVAGTPGTDATAGDTPEALAFSADLVDGGTFEGGEYAGQDLMIWFWAPW